MPLPGFTAGEIYFYFSYTNRPDALLHQEGYGSVTGGRQCCVSVGIYLVKLLPKTRRQLKDVQEMGVECGLIPNNCMASTL